MRRSLFAFGVLTALGCEGRLLDHDLPGGNQPPTINPALALQLGGTGAEQITGLLVASDGSLVLAGSFSGTPDFDPGEGISTLSSLGLTDIFLARYSAGGALLWVRQLGGTDAESAAALSTDAAGNLYLGGSFLGAADFDPGPGVASLVSLGAADGFLAKYTPDGALLWARRFGGSAADSVAAVAVFAGGPVVAAGTFSGEANTLPFAGPTLVSEGGADGFLLAYDDAGTAQWALPIGGPDHDAALALAAGSDGTLAVAGTFRGSADFTRNDSPTRLLALGGDDVFLAAYTAAGQLRWVRPVGGLETESLAAGALALDGTNAPVLAGRFGGTVDFDPGPGVAARTSISEADGFLVRFQSNGDLRAALALGGQGLLQGLRVLPLPDDAVVLTGWFSGAPDFDPGAGARIIASLGRAGASDAFVARYDAGGGLAWVTRFGEATTVPDRSNSGAALARDAAGNLLVGGRFFGTVDFDPGSRALRLTSLGASDGFLVLLTAQGALATTP